MYFKEKKSLQKIDTAGVAKPISLCGLQEMSLNLDLKNSYKIVEYSSFIVKTDFRYSAIGDEFRAHYFYIT